MRLSVLCVCRHQRVHRFLFRAARRQRQRQIFFAVDQSIPIPAVKDRARGQARRRLLELDQIRVQGLLEPQVLPYRPQVAGY